MSRKITNESVEALLDKKPFKKSNMKVHMDFGGVWKMKLHGNTIAAIDEFNMLSISNAGWESNTTKERLNGLPNVRINQKKFVWYLNGVEWNGEWTRVGIV
jgi:hypothetical protein